MLFGSLKVLYAGGPADTAYLFLNAVRFLGMNWLTERRSNWLGITNSTNSVFTRKIKWFFLKKAGSLWVLSPCPILLC